MGTGLLPWGWGQSVPVGRNAALGSGGFSSDRPPCPAVGPGLPCQASPEDLLTRLMPGTALVPH